MLSIIVCSRNSSLLEKLKQNIEATSYGYPYEIIAIDNSRGEYSIFSAYNEGIKMAKGDILCFMHEDVTIETSGWISHVENYFTTNKNLGLLGIIGDCAIPKQKPSYVGFALPVMKYKQQVDSRMQLMVRNSELYDRDGLCKVVLVDGLWFCIPRYIFYSEGARFDDSYFSGFHMYDMDISLQVLKTGKDIAVTDRIMVTHHNNVSTSLNRSFDNELNRFFIKWSKSLPLTSCNSISMTLRLSRISGNYLQTLNCFFLKICYSFAKLYEKMKKALFSTL